MNIRLNPATVLYYWLLHVPMANILRCSVYLLSYMENCNGGWLNFDETP